MRYPADQKAETHERIIDAASRSFRERGSEGMGIAALMQELGLTQGGFYRHFDSKDELYTSALTRGIQQVGDRLVAIAESAPKGQAMRAVIEFYLSAGHMESVGAGCVIAALAPEIRRQPLAVRQKISKAIQALMNRLTPFGPGGLLIPAMAGVLMTARALTDVKAQNDMLKSARAFFVNVVAEKSVN